MLHPYRGRLLASTLLAGVSVVAAPALAQTTTPATTSSTAVQSGVATSDSAPPVSETSAGEIVVTGTLIKNPNLVASAPITTIGQEEVQLRQSNLAEEVLRTIPGAVPSIGSSVNNGNGGASFVDLRGLGSFRNIVLLDGSRLAPSGLAGRVDLNNIPLALVERVDVLTGGASTTYGADAVSGVVNFITRSDFSGADVQASQQISERGDGNIFRVDATIGISSGDGKGNAVFSIGYQQADPVYQGDRIFSQTQYESFSGAASGSGTSVPARFSQNANVGLGITAATRQLNTTTGALVPTFQTYNFNPFNVFLTPFSRYNMYGAGHYEVADGIEVYTRGLFSKNTVQTIVAPSGVFASSVVIPVSNPYLPTAAALSLCQTNAGTAAARPTLAQCTAARTITNPATPGYLAITTTLSRRTPEVGSRTSTFTTQVFDYKAGFRGEITDHLSFDVNGAYGESENRQSLGGYVLTSKVRDALLATNTTTCLSGNTGCVPLNVFGPEGSITPAMIAYLTASSSTVIRTSLAQAHGQINGDIGYTSPFASEPISFALGGEYRKYHANQQSDTLAKTPGELGGAGGAAPDVNGGYDVYEGFAELIAPLVADKPFFHSLTLETGVRYSKYKVFANNTPKFNTTTYKIAGNWEPIEALKLRGNYQHAVRAPNISELFSPVSTGLTNLAADPCAGAAPVNNANLRAICIAQGAPASVIGSIPNPTSGQANITSGGNPAVRPETSNSYSFGYVLRPDFIVPGFTFSADYYNIKVKGAITSPTPGDIIAACFVTAASATAPACTSIRRDPATGSLSGDPAVVFGLAGAISNLGRLKTDGIDATAAYRHNFGFAKLNLSFTGNWTHHSIFQATPTAISRECVGFYSVNCTSIQPKYSWNQRTTVTVHDIDFSVLWRHINKVRQEPSTIATTGAAFIGTLTSGPLAGRTVNFGRIPSFNYIDLTARFGVSRNLDLTIGVTNLFDKNAPIVGQDIGATSYNSGNTYPSTYDAIGRRYAASARMKF